MVKVVRVEEAKVRVVRAEVEMAGVEKVVVCRAVVVRVEAETEVKEAGAETQADRGSLDSVVG